MKKFGFALIPIKKENYITDVFPARFELATFRDYTTETTMKFANRIS